MIKLHMIRRTAASMLRFSTGSCYGVSMARPGTGVSTYMHTVNHVDNKSSDIFAHTRKALHLSNAWRIVP